MAETLPPEVRPLLQAPVFVVMTTINPDGSPQSSVVWAKLDGDTVVISTIRGRRKCRNMERDPRITLLAYDPQDPYVYVELRGTVTLSEEGGVELIDELSRAYDGKPWTVRPAETRVVVRFTPTKVIHHLAAQSRKKS
ncbi:MAG TPA: PPOX class F420-dependent oxidoreductase [Actinophytocola sp.]|uniref:PPOX class F420-dependent oxidoreductase n=1 Tax=Actinophytocola sp. TaxID=1872138 RepID=UPI002DDDA37E|nr:PPOX class F420-dependent oxidoreductase [Actinophytocola sp.]HEV2780604.1 PPOX class F420-dependent oxidoreductase [Actinophytocola sp.]